MKRFLTSDGLSLAYTDEGEGFPLLALPGLTRRQRVISGIHQRHAADALGCRPIYLERYPSAP